MPDFKTLTFIATAIVVLGWYGPWLWSLVRSKWPGGDGKVTPEQAIEAAKLLAKYYGQKGQTVNAGEMKTRAAEIFGGTL